MRYSALLPAYVPNSRQAGINGLLCSEYQTTDASAAQPLAASQLLSVVDRRSAYPKAENFIPLQASLHGLIFLLCCYSELAGILSETNTIVNIQNTYVCIAPEKTSK